MLFSAKLTLLMELTSTKNSELARALYVDPSQISRLRNGVRNAPQKPNAIRKIAEFFARSCTNDFRRFTLAEALQNIRIRGMTDSAELTDCLFAWLSKNDTDADTDAGSFSLPKSYLINNVNENNPSDSSVDPDAEYASSKKKLMVFHGKEGRRRALKGIISQLKASNAPCMIQLSSDESTDWLTEDAQFFASMKNDLIELTHQGCIIRRILPPMKSINDVFDSFTLWLPLYVTGCVRPYYYPRLRDGIYRRTLFIVPGITAMILTSIGWQRESGATLVFSDPEIIADYEREYNQYQAMCLPALNVYDPLTQSEKIIERMRTCFSLPNPSIRKCNTLSFLSLPEALRELQKTKDPCALTQLMCERVPQEIGLSRNVIFNRPCTEIMSLAPLEDLYAGKVRFLNNAASVYTPQSYRLHLEEIVRLLEKYDRYNVVLTDRYPLHCDLYAKEAHSSFLFMLDPPYLIMEIVSPSMIYALWEYLEQVESNGHSAQTNKQHTLYVLREYIKKLPPYNNSEV